MDIFGRAIILPNTHDKCYCYFIDGKAEVTGHCTELDVPL